MVCGDRGHFIGQPIRNSGYPLDEYELTQHYRFWREDLDRASSLGITGIRYGIPWYRVNPAPGSFDWGWVDEVLDYAVLQKGLAVVVDLVHYGVPDWVEESFADPAYPRAVSDYAAAFAHRYRDLVRHYTPLNEPTITAQFCGQRGLWPPYLEGDEGWIRIVLGIVEGIPRVDRGHPGGEPRRGHRARRGREGRAARGGLPLLDGATPPGACLPANGSPPRRVGLAISSTPGYENEGYRPRDSAASRRTRRRWTSSVSITTRKFRTRDRPHGDDVAEVAVEGWVAGLAASLRDFHDRYGLPLIVSETSTDGDDGRRSRWLRDSTAAIERLRLQGIDIRGFTWWPLFDFVDWSHSVGDRRLEEFLVRVPDGAGGSRLAQPPQPSDNGVGDIGVFLRRMGLWRLEPEPGGSLRRVETSAAERLREIVARSSGRSNR